MAWKDGKLTQATIRSKRGGTCAVRAAMPLAVTEDGRDITAATPEAAVIVFDSRPGGRYVLTPRP